MKNDAMKTDGTNQDGLTREQARDELIDLGLREVVGGSAPPDLTQRIIAVATQTASSKGAQAASATSSSATGSSSTERISLAARSRGYAREVLCASVLLATAVGGYFLGGGAEHLRLAMAVDNSRSVARDLPFLVFGRPSDPSVMDDVGYSSRFDIDPSESHAEYSPDQGLRSYVRQPVTSNNKGNSDSKGDADGDRSGGGGKGGGQLANNSGTGGYGNNTAGDEGANSAGMYGVDPFAHQRTITYTPAQAVTKVLPDGTTVYESAPSKQKTITYTTTNGKYILGTGEGDSPLIGGRGEFDTETGIAEARAAEVKAVQRLLAEQEKEDLTGDRYRAIQENRFLDVRLSPLSTFSIDVDTASYAKVRRSILQQNVLPPPDAVRIEEFVNYFSYDYPRPVGKDAAPFAVNTELAGCPWQPGHHLLRVALAGKQIDPHARPKSNLVFLLDVSGSMDSPDKLPLVKDGLRQLVERLNENDRVAIVVYAGASGLVLPSTNGSEKATILSVIDDLQPDGSTNGAAGIELAYQLAEENFITGGANRVILCTDGDFNVGVTSDGGLVRLVEEKAKSGVFLTALGFGIGNHNDSMLEQIADRGNGTYGYIDSRNESYKIFAQQMSGTLVTIAKDVKIQVEFNPALVAGYRLVGYENRMLATEDFADDTKDAGEIGAGHTVTALYELIPAGAPIEPTPGLKYQRTTELTDAARAGEFANVALRYKEPDEDVSKLLEVSVSDPRAMVKPGAEDAEPDGALGDGAIVDRALLTDEASAPELGPMPVGTDDFQFAAAVASFAMILRNSAYQGETSFDAVLEIARGVGPDEFGYRAEFVQIVEAARQIQKANQPQAEQGGSREQ